MSIGNSFKGLVKSFGGGSLGLGTAILLLVVGFASFTTQQLISINGRVGKLEGKTEQSNSEENNYDDLLRKLTLNVDRIGNALNRDIIPFLNRNADERGGHTIPDVQILSEMLEPGIIPVTDFYVYYNSENSQGKVNWIWHVPDDVETTSGLSYNLLLYSEDRSLWKVTTLHDPVSLGETGEYRFAYKPIRSYEKMRFSIRLLETSLDGMVRLSATLDTNIVFVIK